MRKRLEKAFAKDIADPILALPGGRGRLLLFRLAVLRRHPRPNDDLLRLAARFLDLLLRRRGELVRLDGDGLGQVAVAEDLETVLLALDGPGLDQLVEIDLGQAEALEDADVDERVLDAEGVGEPALGNPALQRHLAALEADEVHVAGAGLLALAAAAGGLAGAARLAATDPLLLFHAAAGRRGQLRQLIHSSPLH